MSNMTRPGEKILAVKEALKLTNSKISEATGVTPATVSRYASGKMEVTEEWADRFCRAYHVDIEWFLHGDGDPVYTGKIDDLITRDVSGAGNRLAEMRHGLGMTQKDVREILGLTHTAYNRIENGHVKLTVENAQKIEDEYGVGAEWLLYGDESKKDYPVGRKMIEWLWENKEERERIWNLMREKG